MGGGGGGRNVAGLGRLGSGMCSWDLHAFPPVVLTAKSENINGNCERGCEGELMIPKKLSLGGGWPPPNLLSCMGLYIVATGRLED